MSERFFAGAQRTARYSAIALGASFPISTALDNVLLALLALAWAASGIATEEAQKMFKNKYLWMPPLLFAALAAGTLYGPAPLREAGAMLGKYADLLFIPIIAMVLRNDDDRRAALHAFAASIALTIVLSWLLWLRLLPAWPIFVWDQISPSVFKYKATHNILVAFGVFVFLWLARNITHARWKIIFYTFAVLGAADVVLLVNGATGHLMLAALAVLLVAQRLSGRQALLAACAVVAACAVMLSVPGALRDRAHVIVQELSALQAGHTPTRDESAGVRLQTYRNTLDIIAAHPLTGVGTGGFAQAYARQVEGTLQERTVNPHNEYLLVTVQIGVAGLLLLLALWWAQWRAAHWIEAPLMRGLAQGLVITMVLACAVNSMLLDHTEGLFYAWFSGVLFGGCGGGSGGGSGIKYADKQLTTVPA